MKKIILIIAFIGTTLVANAQVGIGNTDPKATLDVTGVTTAGVPDGVIVPRFTRAELTAKSAAYSAANQLGALVFVTAVAGGTDAKTATVTAVGFYYYAANDTWVGVGGAAAPAFTGRTAQVLTAAYDWTNSGAGLVDFYEFTSGTDPITLPSPVTHTGKIIHVRNATGASVNFGASDGITRPRSVPALVASGALRIWSDGVNWHNIAGRN